MSPKNIIAFSTSDWTPLKTLKDLSPVSKIVTSKNLKSISSQLRTYEDLIAKKKMVPKESAFISIKRNIVKNQVFKK